MPFTRDEDFAERVGQNPDPRFEMTASEDLIIGPPNRGRFAATNATIIGQFDAWARRSSHASWVNKQRMVERDEYSQDNCFHCPDVVFELRSQSDRMPVPGWLIDPERRAVEIYRPEFEAEVREDAMSVEGEVSVAGFVLDPGRVWKPW